ncbi:cytochrome c peroxidase [Algoriphagus sp. 4150]|uniref:cytochrome-c peroxidase n=1 Tax=Algoriphagus sp. 4150 TaxID=2817756 RepID=UPI002862CCCC|nr:cytochrome c peroxidase [Algoriphagus sp. 4150]MDR7131442.1 cytochrome c peroxidase [Algoriphagus sp. 4150]
MDSNYGIGTSFRLVISFLGLVSCTTVVEDQVPIGDKVGTGIELEIPEGFPSPVYMMDNPLTEEGVLLGKRLFFDKEISSNGKVSCASCHNPHLAFSDGVALGREGVSGNPLERHSPALFNLAWMGNGLFWDGGSKNLESQALGPLTHADEMGMDLSELEHRLRQDPTYPHLFEDAFDNGVSAGNVAKALAQFQRTLVSAKSRYDQSLRASSGVSLSESELRGLGLVRQHCGACHSGELLTDNQFHNNGIDGDFSDLSHEMIHLGRYRITHTEGDVGAFKTPSLRNVMVTAPYMHDGRFTSIDEVITHYTSGVADVETTSPLLFQQTGKVGISLTDDEKSAIKDFLETLTDHDFISNPSWTVVN